MKSLLSRLLFLSVLTLLLGGCAVFRPAPSLCYNPIVLQDVCVSQRDDMIPPPPHAGDEVIELAICDFGAPPEPRKRAEAMVMW